MRLKPILVMLLILAAIVIQPASAGSNDPCQATKNIKVQCSTDKSGNKWCGYSGQTTVLCGLAKTPPPKQIAISKPADSQKSQCWESEFKHYSDGLDNAAGFCANAFCGTDSNGKKFLQS